MALELGRSGRAAQDGNGHNETAAIPAASSRSKRGSDVATGASDATATMCGSSGAAAAICRARAMHFEFRKRIALETLDETRSTGVMCANRCRRGSARSSSRTSWIRAQRFGDATITSCAPAWRWRQESLPGLSKSKSSWACLRVETRRPRADEHRQHFLDQRGLAAAAPAGETEARPRYAAWSLNAFGLGDLRRVRRR